MQANRSAALARIHASEQGVNRRPSEPGGISVNGVSLTAYNEYRASHGLPPVGGDDLEAAITPEEEAAFYDWKILTPVRFDDLPTGVDYAVADFATNSGVAGALDAIRFLLGIPVPPAPWRMDEALLNKLGSMNPALAVSAVCDLRWSRMQASADFTQPSIVPGKIIGNGRAFRMSSCRRGALELLGFPAEADHYAAPALTAPMNSERVRV